MAFQSSVFQFTGSGVLGELFTDSPYRAQSYILNSADPTQNYIARACTVKADGVTVQVGTGDQIIIHYAGILANPKVLALTGSAGNTLAPQLLIPNNTQVEVVSMGSMVVSLSSGGSIGNYVIYDKVTGVLNSIESNAAVPMGQEFAYATVNYFILNPEVPNLAVITLNPAMPTPSYVT